MIDPQNRYSAEEALNHPFLKLAENTPSSNTNSSSIKPLWLIREEKLLASEEQKLQQSQVPSGLSPKDKMKLKLKKTNDFIPKSTSDLSKDGSTDKFIWKEKDLQKPETHPYKNGSKDNTTINN